MIHKNWKKRFRNSTKDKDFKGNYFGFGFLISFGVVVSFLIEDFLNLPFILSLLLFVGYSVFSIYEIFFREKSFLDEEVIQQEKEMQHIEEETEDEQERTYTNDVSTWHAKRERMLSLVVGESEYFQSEMLRMICDMQYILENCSLSDEQKKYFVHDFPEEMCNILSTYGKLQGIYKAKVENDILQLIRDTCEEWQHSYVEPLQRELAEQCTKQIQHVYRKEEKVYITD